VNNYDAIIPGKSPYIRSRVFSKDEIHRFRKKERLIELRKAAINEQKRLTALRKEALRIANLEATQNRRKLKEDEPDKTKRVQMFERWSWTWETSFKVDQLRKNVMRTDKRLEELNKQHDKLPTK
jgi:hypothetical protein